MTLCCCYLFCVVTCRQFSLVGIPLVDGLRSFLETFRLPGEAPVISLILEHFAVHWLVRLVHYAQVVNVKVVTLFDVCHMT